MKNTLRLLVTVCTFLCTELYAGSLKVYLFPLEGAVAVSGRWQLDGGAWRSDGATVSVASNTTHQVAYKAVAGWITPAPVTVTIKSTGTTVLNATYIDGTSIRVNLTPSSGQWRVDGGAWKASGALVAGLTAASHLVEYTAVVGYNKPPSENVTPTAGQTTTLNRSYGIRSAQLTLTLTPVSAQWRINGGAWLASQAVATLAPGSYTIDYSAVNGYVTPDSETYTLTSGQIIGFARSYVPLADVTMALFPSSARWSVDGGPWQVGGAIVQNLGVGSHTISYSEVPQYATPPAETIALVSGQSLALTRTYIQLAQILIGLVPATGQYRLNGGAWQPSGTSFFVMPGDYTVDYSSLEDYDTPGFENITLTAAGIFATTRYYTSQKPTLHVDLAPSSGQWRVDGGAWQASSATVSELTTGTHTIDYTDVGEIYAQLPSETVSLGLRENAVITRSYPIKPPASLTITLNPTAAQWRVDGGAWQLNGATVANLSYDVVHAIDYAPVDGYLVPASETFTPYSGQQVSLSRTYTQLAMFGVTLNPMSAQWRIDGGAWQTSGAIVGNLSLAEHTIDYASVVGYITPPSETVMLVSGGNPPITRSYTHLAMFGVMLNPMSAQWRIDGGAWLNSGTIVENLSLGEHTIDYASAVGYITPPSEMVTLVSGGNPLISRSYTPLAMDGVMLNPMSAQWRIDGGAWQNSGAIVENQALGEHTIDYAPVVGYITLPSEMVTLVSGGNPLISRSYTPLAMVGVMLNPMSAQWRIDGGAWLNSGTIVENLSLGEHTIDYRSVVGYITPPSEVVTLISGGNPSITRAYTPVATLTVNLDPSNAQWRVDGGKWLASGVPAMVLQAGIRVIEYLPVPGYETPQPEEVELVLGETRTLSRSYRLGEFAILHRFEDTGNNTTTILGSDGALYCASSTGIVDSAGHIYRINQDGSGYQELKRFGSELFDGSGPIALFEGSDGVLYGCTRLGGGLPSAKGTIFRINKEGTGYAVLHVFDGLSQGATPSCLIESSGMLFGATTVGGAYSNGVIFVMGKAGTGYGVLASLPTYMGTQVQAITEGPGGYLYGTARSGGSYNAGTVFRISKSGTNLLLLKSFLGGTDGASPHAGLLAGIDGLLYGTVYSGGTANYGHVFRINPDGTGYTILHHFQGGIVDGRNSETALSEDANGILYGATLGGGTSQKGTVFRLYKDGSRYAILMNFTGDVRFGGMPRQRVIAAPNGVLYGSNTDGGFGGFGLLFKMYASGSAFTVLRDFGAPGGAYPYTSGIVASDGRIYGTTNFGGSKRYGVVYGMNRDGSGYTVLHQFLGTAAEGGYPYSNVAEASDGMLYGTNIGISGVGVLYRMNKDGSSYSMVHSFSGLENGSTPLANVIEGSDGALYGTCNAGCSPGFGGIYRTNKDGTNFTFIHTFGGGTSDGAGPFSGLVEAEDGRLYGTTPSGGASNLGTVFGVNKDGTGYRVLYHFAGITDGAAPSAGLCQGRDGFLYGTTPAQTGYNDGTVYRLAVDGSGYAVIKTFMDPYTGLSPSIFDTLVEKDGVLYGCTSAGGSFNKGVVYMLNVDGTVYRVLVNFGLDLTDGWSPSGLIMGSDGNLYGTTYNGAGGGTVFRCPLPIK